ncbi:MAG: hypothetical protein GY716_01795 [bacterium]|nr:hypothetical protein [bacterium]
MSDFLFTTQSACSARLGRVLREYLGPLTGDVEEIESDWGSLAVARAPHDPPLLVADDRARTVLAGRPLVRAPVAATEDGQPLSFAHARLGEPGNASWDTLLDGPFAALRIEHSGKGHRLVTDLFGWLPVYRGTDRQTGDLVLGTHLEGVACAARRGAAIDPVSAAELLLNQHCVPPRTLYDGVELVAAAGEVTFDGSTQVASSTYWEPREDAFSDLDEAALSVREALRENLNAACPPGSSAGILLSGGEDARAVLGAVSPDVDVSAFTLADEENREVRVARAAARAYGARFTFAQRKPDHYPAIFEDAARIAGATSGFMDLHYLRIHEELRLAELPIVLGGLCSDLFLKGGRAPEDPDPALPFRLPATDGIRAELVAEVRDRRVARRERLLELRPRSAAEWDQVWPGSIWVYDGNFQGARRMFNVHEPYQCNAMIRAASRTPLEWKQERRLFHRAMRPFFLRSWYVPHARTRFPVLGRWGNAPLRPFLRAGRELGELLRGRAFKHQFGWPKPRHVVSSPATAALRERHPLASSPLGVVFDETDESRLWQQLDSAWHPRRRMIALQLGFLTAHAAGERR